jgi:hypothetical protein
MLNTHEQIDKHLDTSNKDAHPTEGINVCVHIFQCAMQEESLR